MGTNFFSRAFTPWHGGIQGLVDSADPAYNISGKTVMDPATLAGPNSWISKESSYDPLLQSGAGKYVNGAGVQAGQNWQNRNVVTQTPTPFQNVTPTLTDATNQYVAATQRAMQARPQAQQQQSPYNAGGW